jgi:MoaA/NifB/PqqE/SkfB family radical SAM enzyme
MSDTYCSAFWTHTNLRPGNQVFPCCRFKHSIQSFDGNLNSVLTTPTYEKLRHLSSTGQKIPGCEKCYHEENNSKQSYRQWFNQKYQQDVVDLRWVELGLDNQCNLTCDGCSEEFSSAWATKKSLNTIKKFNVTSIKEISYIPDSITEISFLGGEPLMNNRHIRLLRMAKNKANIHIHYNTNGTFMLDLDTIDLLNQFKSVNFVVSVDGYQELNDKVRQGSHWEDIESFIEQILATNFAMQIHTVIHKNNWQGLGDLRNFIRSKNLNWRINVLTFPNHLDIVNLDLHEKQQLIDILSEYPDISEQDYIKSHIGISQ